MLRPSPSSPVHRRPAVTVENKDVPFIEAGLVLGNSGDGIGQRGPRRRQRRRQQACSGVWGFNTKGWVESARAMQFDNRSSPSTTWSRGGRLLQGGHLRRPEHPSLPLRARFSMYADRLEPAGRRDAIDQRPARGRAQQGPYGDAPRPLPAGQPDGVPRRAQQASPRELAPLASARQFFKASSCPHSSAPSSSRNNYARALSGREPAAHRQGHGHRDLSPEAEGRPQRPETKISTSSTAPRPTCFDTAPFRDSTYERVAVHPDLQGPWRATSWAARTRRPTTSAPNSATPTKGDKSKRIVNCE